MPKRTAAYTRGYFLSTVGIAVAGEAARAQSAGDAPSPTQQATMLRITQNYMATNRIPGLSVAFARNGQIVFTQGYGLADVERHRPVTPESLFRIASISKTFSSASIYTLVEDGRLDLNATVFGPAGVLNQFRLPSVHGDWAQQIQIRHLLTHTGGGWPNGPGDPMFANLQLDHQELIAHTLATHPLSNPPGTRYAYSNFGYCVLGRVIEKLSGVPYASFVSDRILSRVGNTDMRIGENTPQQRAPNEVAYYYGKVYAMNVTRMDSHGGWIATPSDLLRFAIHDVGYPPQPQLLTPDHVRDMTTGTTANPHYGKGWEVNSARHWWHFGRLPGTASVLLRTEKGTMWAAVINGTVNHNTADHDIDQYMWSMARSIPQWPT